MSVYHAALAQYEMHLVHTPLSRALSAIECHQARPLFMFFSAVHRAQSHALACSHERGELLGARMHAHAPAPVNGLGRGNMHMLAFVCS